MCVLDKGYPLGRVNFHVTIIRRGDGDLLAQFVLLSGELPEFVGLSPGTNQFQRLKTGHRQGYPYETMLTGYYNRNIHCLISVIYEDGTQVQDNVLSRHRLRFRESCDQENCFIGHFARSQLGYGTNNWVNGQ